MTDQWSVGGGGGRWPRESADCGGGARTSGGPQLPARRPRADPETCFTLLSACNSGTVEEAEQRSRGTMAGSGGGNLQAPGDLQTPIGYTTGRSPTILPLSRPRWVLLLSVPLSATRRMHSIRLKSHDTAVEAVDGDEYFNGGR